jgi:hypothetical protein
MAVKPITNSLPLQKDQVSRASQVSDKDNTVNNSTNREKKIFPGGKDFTKNYEIILQDLDSAIMNHIKNVMKLKVRENGELVSVPIMYGNEERWASIKKHGVIRDKKGALLLPLMVFKRTNVEFNDTLPSYKHDINGEFAQVVRSSKWSKDNKYTQFSVQQGAKPVQEQIITGVPQYVNTTYEFNVASSYITQMNTIVESFVQQHNTYWGDNTSYRFLCQVEGGMADASEVDVSGERIIKTNFTVLLKGYLLPEIIANVVQQMRFNTKKQLTAGRVTFAEDTSGNSLSLTKRTSEVSDISEK